MQDLVCFDTSAINALFNDPLNKEIELSLPSRFTALLSETAVGEVFATTNTRRREELRECCVRLSKNGVCLEPPNWIIIKMIQEFARYPSYFDWRAVRIECSEMEQELLSGRLFTDDLAERQRIEMRSRKKEFVTVFSKPRTAYERLFRENPDNRPDSVFEFVREMRRSGWLVKWSRTSHERFAAREVANEETATLLRLCPPFEALTTAFFVALYQCSVRDRHSTEKYTAGAFDLYSAVYLPYCKYFVTADMGQCKALSVVAQTMMLKTKIVLYENFRNAVLLPGGVVV